MYWLLDIETQNAVQDRIIKLNDNLLAQTRERVEQVFPFVGRKSREISRRIIQALTDPGDVVCDPFSGSGTFVYASLDLGRKAIANEWEPFAYRMSTLPLKELPSAEEVQSSLNQLEELVLADMFDVYKTKCPSCGAEFMFDGLFFDRVPEEYFHPTRHERMGRNGENVIYRGKYKCPNCKKQEAHYSLFDEQVRLAAESRAVAFPNARLIENSRINFSAPDFTQYANLFSKRQQVALMTLKHGIEQLPEATQSFFYSVFLSILHLGKFVDYHCKSQDNHCPNLTLKENNLYHRFLEKVKKYEGYLRSQSFNKLGASVTCCDYRDFLDAQASSSIDLLMTDPPYGDNAQYFEQAQRVHPFLSYSLIDDQERLSKEVVISNAPSRRSKSTHEQLFTDYETLFLDARRIIKDHGYFVMYFRPKQSDWLRDLNELKNMARKNGFEPLQTFPLSNDDPSMRVLASAAWAFSKDVCFVFLRLNDNEVRWYENDIDVDELIYLAALDASGNNGEPFVHRKFNDCLTEKLRAKRLTRLLSNKYTSKIEYTLARFTVKNGAQYYLQSAPPYDFNSSMSAETRVREFAPVVVEELCASGNGFTFEDFVIRLSTYIENGSREVIQSLHNANKLVPELLLRYAYEDETSGLFHLRDDTTANQEELNGRISIRKMDPYDFERLVSDWLKAKGYVRSETVGGAGDRGVDVWATNARGELEFWQCKRYQKGNNVGSQAVQRIHSNMHSRNGKAGYVVTTSDFTSDGKDEGRITGVGLINGDTFIQSLEIYFPGKYCL